MHLTTWNTNECWPNAQVGQWLAKLLVDTTRQRTHQYGHYVPVNNYSVSDAYVNFVRKRLHSEPQHKRISLKIRYVNDLCVLNAKKRRSNSKDLLLLVLGYFWKLEIWPFGLLFARSWRPDFKKNLATLANRLENQPKKLKKRSHYAIIMPNNFLPIAILFHKTWRKFWHVCFLITTIKRTCNNK